MTSKTFAPRKAERPYAKRLYERSRSKKKRLSLEGRLALRTAKSLESLQVAYAEMHNKMLAKVMFYLAELEQAGNTLSISFPLDRAACGRIVEQVAKHLEHMRRATLRNMLDLVEIFQRKLDQRSAAELRGQPAEGPSGSDLEGFGSMGKIDAELLPGLLASVPHCAGAGAYRRVDELAVKGEGGGSDPWLSLAESDAPWGLEASF